MWVKITSACFAAVLFFSVEAFAHHFYFSGSGGLDRCSWIARVTTGDLQTSRLEAPPHGTTSQNRIEFASRELAQNAEQELADPIYRAVESMPYINDAESMVRARNEWGGGEVWQRFVGTQANLPHYVARHAILALQSLSLAIAIRNRFFRSLRQWRNTPLATSDLGTVTGHHLERVLTEAQVSAFPEDRQGELDAAVAFARQLLANDLIPSGYHWYLRDMINRYERFVVPGEPLSHRYFGHFPDGRDFVDLIVELNYYAVYSHPDR